MRDQLEALEELQQIDLGISEVDRELERIPAHVKELDKEVEVLRQLLARERGELEEAETWDKQAEREIKIQEDLLAKSRAKQGAARNERELNAAVREIDAIRKAVSEREEERLQVLQAITDRRQSIAKHEAEIAELQKVLDAADAEAREKMAEVEKVKQQRSGAREAVLKRLNPRVAKLYEHIRARRGTAVAEVIGETCQGCNMAMPPQVYIEIQRADRILQCPSCNRIVFFRDHRGPHNDAPE